MNIRKIAVLGGFAAGAAVAFAPLASADDLTSVLDTEISSLNSIFTTEATIAGDSSDITSATAANPFDIITPADIATVQGAGTTPFDYLIYGVDPTNAGISPDPGAYDVFNGALTEFSDALNVELYSLQNNGALDTNVADFIGSSSSIADGLSQANATDAAEYFLNFGLGDLQGFFDIPSL
jgi:hypothetical protein